MVTNNAYCYCGVFLKPHWEYDKIPLMFASTTTAILEALKYYVSTFQTSAHFNVIPLGLPDWLLIVSSCVHQFQALITLKTCTEQKANRARHGTLPLQQCINMYNQYSEPQALFYRSPKKLKIFDLKRTFKSFGCT